MYLPARFREYQEARLCPHVFANLGERKWVVLIMILPCSRYLLLRSFFGRIEMYRKIGKRKWLLTRRRNKA